MFHPWIDDLRTPPNETWRWAKSVGEAKIHFIQLGGLNGKPGIVSLDHDAGEYEFMGGDYIEFLKWLEQKRYVENIDLNNIQIHLHTMNTVGHLRMKAIVEHNGWEEIYDV